jgi:hypothetical protein
MSGGGARPIHGAWLNGDEWQVHSWHPEGFHHYNQAECSLDLVWPIKE